MRPAWTSSASCTSRRRAGSASSPNAAFRETFAAFDRRGLGRLLLARDADGQAVATLMLLDCGDRVIERYGASSTAGAAARANYLVKWESIRASRDRGMARYDMWGTDQEGVATFKASFGGYERQYIGAWELVTNRIAYQRLRRHRAPARPCRPVRLAVRRRRSGTRRRCTVVDIATETPDGWDARRGGRARRARHAGHRMGGPSSVAGR